VPGILSFLREHIGSAFRNDYPEFGKTVNFRHKQLLGLGGKRLPLTNHARQAVTHRCDCRLCKISCWAWRRRQGSCWARRSSPGVPARPSVGRPRWCRRTGVPSQQARAWLRCWTSPAPWSPSWRSVFGLDVALSFCAFVVFCLARAL